MSPTAVGSGWPLRGWLGSGMGHSVLGLSKEFLGLWSPNLGKIEGCGLCGITQIFVTRGDVPVLNPKLCHSWWCPCPEGSRSEAGGHRTWVGTLLRGWQGGQEEDLGDTKDVWGHCSEDGRRRTWGTLNVAGDHLRGHPGMAAGGHGVPQWGWRTLGTISEDILGWQEELGGSRWSDPPPALPLR